MPKGQNYFSFLLRAWKEHESAEWRFSIQETAQEKQQHFSDFKGLVKFLTDLLNLQNDEIRGDIDANPSDKPTE